jgi:2,4-dienoyl-CoA reductase-like NADH-dependent reductase (Old Yellow Enzyme family)
MPVTEKTGKHAMDSSPEQLPKLDALFTPFTCGALRLANRFVMSPMTRSFSPGNLLSAEAPSYYARRARGGAALVVTEGTAIPHKVAHQDATIPNFYGGSMAVWQETAARVHAAGGAIFAQLWHTGLFRNRAETLNPEELSFAPSQVGPEEVHPMTESDIAEVVEAYAQGAENARAAGFDGIEIHGAHGYLPDQFFWPSTNKRSDGYGGPIENRVRFAVSVISEIRRRTAPDFPIMFRFSQWKATRYDYKLARSPQELESWLGPLAAAGVDIFDASTRRFWEPEFEGSPLNLAGWAKKVTGKASMTVGSVGLKDPLEVGAIGDMPTAALSISGLRVLVEMFERGDFDLIALGRVILTNPEWPNLVKDGKFDRLRPYNPKTVAEQLECAAG